MPSCSGWEYLKLHCYYNLNDPNLFFLFYHWQTFFGDLRDRLKFFNNFEKDHSRIITVMSGWNLASAVIDMKCHSPMHNWQQSHDNSKNSPWAHCAQVWAKDYLNNFFIC